MPPGAEWHTEGWSGAVLRYAQLVGASEAEERLLTFLRTYQQAGMALMKG